MARKKVKPLVPPGRPASQAAAPVTSLKLARRLTTAFHALLVSEAAVCADASLSAGARSAALAALAARMAAMGGRAAYQEASALSTTHFRSSRYVFKTLTRLGLAPGGPGGSGGGRPRLRVLEVGAVNAQLLVCPWLDVTALDIASRDPRIRPLDFFDLPVTAHAYDARNGALLRVPVGRPVGAFDVVVNVMVLNCVGEPGRRCEMLVRCRDHLVPGGLLFFALPSRCLDMSAHFTRSRLEALLAILGFSVLSEKRTPKISFYALQRVDLPFHDTRFAHVQAAAASPDADGAPSAGGGGGGAGVGRKRKREADAESGETGATERAAAGAGAAGAAPLPRTGAAAAAAAGEAAAAPPPPAWAPVILCRSHAEAATLAALAPPLASLPPGELPVTGFTLTDFGITVDAAWVRHTHTCPAGGAADARGSVKGGKSAGFARGRASVPPGAAVPASAAAPRSAPPLRGGR